MNQSQEGHHCAFKANLDVENQPWFQRIEFARSVTQLGVHRPDSLRWATRSFKKKILFTHPTITFVPTRTWELDPSFHAKNLPITGNACEIDCHWLEILREHSFGLRIQSKIELGVMYFSTKICLQRLTPVRKTHKAFVANAWQKTKVFFKPRPPSFLGLDKTFLLTKWEPKYLVWSFHN